MYQIIETTVDGEYIKTLVAFTFTDESQETIEIPHFMPRNREEVIAGIENREVSEQAKRDAPARNAAIAATL